MQIKYQRSLRRMEKSQLDLDFLNECKKNQVYPNFVRRKNITRFKKKTQNRYHNLLLNDAIKEKLSNLQNLKTTTSELRQLLRSRTTWMKFKLICFSIGRLLQQEKRNILSRHNKNLKTLIDLKRISDGITDNPNDTIVNLTDILFLQINWTYWSLTFDTD